MNFKIIQKSENSKEVLIHKKGPNEHHDIYHRFEYGTKKGDECKDEKDVIVDGAVECFSEEMAQRVIDDFLETDKKK